MSWLYSLSIACAIAFQAGAPSDVPAGHWAFKAVDNLYTAGILQGYPAASEQPVARIAPAISQNQLAAALAQTDRTSSSKVEIKDLKVQAERVRDDIRRTKQDLKSTRSLFQQISQEFRDIFGPSSKVGTAG